MKIELLGGLTRPVKLGWNEREMAGLLKRILTLDEDKHVTINHKKGVFQIFFKGNMENVRRELHDWLETKDLDPNQRVVTLESKIEIDKN